MEEVIIMRRMFCPNCAINLCKLHQEVNSIKDELNFTYGRFGQTGMGKTQEAMRLWEEYKRIKKKALRKQELAAWRAWQKANK